MTYFVHDGQDIVEERNNAGVLVADYVYGPQVDEPLVMTRGGVGYYYFTDGLGSVRNLTNAAGAIIETYDYDPYGKPTTLSTVGNPIMFTGRWYDAESGNYYYRARQYSPTLGRFLQRDPIGYYDSMNLYQYVLGNPINSVDPFGLQTDPENESSKDSRSIPDITGPYTFPSQMGGKTIGIIGISLMGIGAATKNAALYYGGVALEAYELGQTLIDFGNLPVAGQEAAQKIKDLTDEHDKEVEDLGKELDQQCEILNGG